MLFDKFIVSFVGAIALAISVTATSSCRSPQTLTCCDSTIPFTSLSIAQQSELISADSNTNENLHVGTDCLVPTSQQCPQMMKNLCCDAIQNKGSLSNVAANCQ